MSDSAFRDNYSDAVGAKIDAKFTSFQFGTNIRGLTSGNKDPFRRNNTVFLPNNQTNMYPGFDVPPCTFDTSCCNMPPRTGMTVSGRLHKCYDPNSEEALTKWSYNTTLPRHAKRYTTKRVGLDVTEN